MSESIKEFGYAIKVNDECYIKEVKILNGVRSFVLTVDIKEAMLINNNEKYLNLITQEVRGYQVKVLIDVEYKEVGICQERKEVEKENIISG